MTFRRMLPFLLVNVLVSAVVVLGLLYWWENQQADNVALQQTIEAASILPEPTALPESFATVSTAELEAAEPTPADQPTLYVVKGGDTLGSISTLYGVPIDDIMAANGLSNADFLQIGQELTIPIGGLSTATPAPEPSATPNVAPSPIPTEPLAQGEAIIEIREVVGVGELTEEAVTIVNTGTRAIALQNWRLRDEQGFEYTFGQSTLFGEGAGIQVHTEAGRSDALNLYWGLEEAVWQPGERVLLVDAEGTQQADYVIPGEGE